jgi:hypothetical protein
MLTITTRSNGRGSYADWISREKGDEEEIKAGERKHLPHK